MAPISSITSSLVSTLQGTTPVAPAEPVASTTSSSATIADALASSGRAFTMGLAMPRNHGDIEALFAEIATRFGVEMAKANNYAEAAEDAKRSTSLTAAAGNLAFFAGLNLTIAAAEANIEKQNAIIAQKTLEIKEANDQLDAAEAQYDAYRSEWNDNTEKQFTNVGKIIELGFELIVATGDDAVRIQNEIDALEAENSQLFDRNLYLDGEMLKLSGQIIELGLKIAGLEIERGWAELSKAFSEAEIGVAQGLLDFFSLVLIPFSVDLALRTMSEAGRASFEMADDLGGLDSAIADAANNIAEQAQRMGEIANARKALEQLPTNDPATAAAIRDFLSGNGLPGDSSPEEPVPTDAVLGLVAALRDMLGKSLPLAGQAVGQVQSDGQSMAVGGPESRRPPNSVDLTRQSIGETLPSGQGDPDRVASEAAGLAAGLAMLRSILGQVALGESSLGTQMPGPSGRLTLAI